MNTVTAKASQGTALAEGEQLASLTPVGAWRLTAHELVRTTLRKGILSGTLPGGARLVQAEIAEQLKVSTTPVREALRDLATEGLIRLDTHRGATVRSISLAEAKEIYDLRLLLEPMAMRKAAQHISDEQIRQAAELCNSMKEAEDEAAWMELNRRFHHLLTSAAGGSRLPALVASLQDSAALYVGVMIHSKPELRRKGDREHRQMLTALRRRDADAAEKTMREHLCTTMRALEADA